MESYRRFTNYNWFSPPNMKSTENVVFEYFTVLGFVSLMQHSCFHTDV